MKVLLLNGSPNEFGCTFTALAEVAGELAELGIDSRIVHVGASVKTCTLCDYCSKQEQPVCSISDTVNEVIAELDEYDGIIVGSPVHYAGASAQITAFLNRIFYAAASKLAYKPAAAVVSARRAGTTAALDQLNKFFTINNMPVVSSGYWNMVHGQTPAEVRQDEEGLQIMRNLARNMAWLLQCIAAGKEQQILPPRDAEERIRTNFIREIATPETETEAE